jgi:hypothetical protein
MGTMIVRIENCIRIIGDTHDGIIGYHLVNANSRKIATQINNNLRSVSRYLSNATSYLMSTSVDGDVHCLK